MIEDRATLTISLIEGASFISTIAQPWLFSTNPHRRAARSFLSPLLSFKAYSVNRPVTMAWRGIFPAGGVVAFAPLSAITTLCLFPISKSPLSLNKNKREKFPKIWNLKSSGD